MSTKSYDVQEVNEHFKELTVIPVTGVALGETDDNRLTLTINGSCYVFNIDMLEDIACSILDVIRAQSEAQSGAKPPQSGEHLS